MQSISVSFIYTSQIIPNMAKAKKAAAIVRAKRKLWFKLVAPKMLNSVTFGETLAFEANDVVGRISNVNLMNLTRDIKKQNVRLDLKVKEVKGETASTEVVKYSLNPAFLKRIVRKGKTRIDRSLVAKTSDNVRIRIKPMLLCNGKLKSNLLAKLAHSADDFIFKKVEKMSFGDLLRDIMNTKFQKEVSSSLKKLYPVRSCEVKSFGLEAEKIKLKRGKVRKIEEKKEEKPEEKPEEAKEKSEVKKEPKKEPKAE